MKWPPAFKDTTIIAKPDERATPKVVYMSKFDRKMGACALSYRV
jgi:hypothetical protein